MKAFYKKDIGEYRSRDKNVRKGTGNQNGSYSFFIPFRNDSGIYMDGAL